MWETLADWGKILAGGLSGGVLVQLLNSWIGWRKDDRTFFSDQYRQLLDDERKQVRELRTSMDQLLDHVEALKQDKIRQLEEIMKLKIKGDTK